MTYKKEYKLGMKFVSNNIIKKSISDQKMKIWMLFIRKSHENFDKTIIYYNTCVQSYFLSVFGNNTMKVMKPARILTKTILHKLYVFTYWFGYIY